MARAVGAYRVRPWTRRRFMTSCAVSASTPRSRQVGPTRSDSITPGDATWLLTFRFQWRYSGHPRPTATRAASRYPRQTDPVGPFADEGKRARCGILRLRPLTSDLLQERHARSVLVAEQLVEYRAAHLHLASDLSNCPSRHLTTARRIAPSTYYDARVRIASAQDGRDEQLKEQIAQVHRDNYGVYGARKVWLELNRQGIPVARCTVEQLMAQLGLRGARRGRKTRTTRSDPTAARPPDRVNRNFAPRAPHQLWVADFSYVSTWTGNFDLAEAG